MMGTKTLIMLCLVAYRMYAKNKPIRQVDFKTFLQKGVKKHEVSFIK